MGELHLTYRFLYLDDIVIFSATYEEHLKRLDAVLERLQKAGLRVKASKCKLFQSSIKYLGHVISEHGVTTDPGKVLAVRNWPVPRSVSEVQTFLSFVGLYRRFIPKFSFVAKPLHDRRYSRKPLLDWWSSAVLSLLWPLLTTRVLLSFIQMLGAWVLGQCCTSRLMETCIL